MCPHLKKKEYFRSTRIMIWTKIHFIKIYLKQISNLFSSSSLITRTVLCCSYCLFIYWLWSHYRAIFTIFLAVYTIAFFPVFISFNLVLARARYVQESAHCVAQKCHYKHYRSSVIFEWSSRTLSIRDTRTDWPIWFDQFIPYHFSCLSHLEIKSYLSKNGS